jgi:hypothetical protein
MQSKSGWRKKKRWTAASLSTAAAPCFTVDADDSAAGP